MIENILKNKEIKIGNKTYTFRCSSDIPEKEVINHLNQWKNLSKINQPLEFEIGGRKYSLNKIEEDIDKDNYTIHCDFVEKQPIEYVKINLTIKNNE